MSMFELGNESYLCFALLIVPDTSFSNVIYTEGFRYRMDQYNGYAVVPDHEELVKKDLLQCSVK
jgi:hypothetical protein